LFKIGNIHKPNIATAVAKLVNIWGLSLDETLAEYMPELSLIKCWDTATINMSIMKY